MPARLTFALLLLLALLAVPAPAFAATGPALTAFQLAQIRPLVHIDGLALRDQVAAAFPVVKSTLSAVIAPGGHTTRAICHPTNVVIGATGFCWNTTDDTTNSWFPQGITGSGDGVNGSVLYSPCPGCPGRKVVATSWRSGNAHPAGANKLARVTFTDVTGGLAGAVYRHALLVEPDGSAEGFREINSHADGLTWYGNKLLLFTGGDTPGLAGAQTLVRIFDLTQFWRMNSTSSGNVGCVGGVCSAAWSEFALPQIGSYTFSTPATCVSLDAQRPCFHGVSLDRSGADHVVTVEYVPGGSGGRILRWPLDAATARLLPGSDGLVRPTEGWASPVWDTQGAAFTGREGVISGRCPDGYPAVSYMPNVAVPGGGYKALVSANGTTYSKSCLHRVTIAADRSSIGTSYLSIAPGNSQNLAYWPSSQELWLVNEYRGDTSGTYGSNRLVLSLTCPGLAC